MRYIRILLAYCNLSYQRGGLGFNLHTSSDGGMRCILSVLEFGVILGVGPSLDTVVGVKFDELSYKFKSEKTMLCDFCYHFVWSEIWGR